MSGATLMQHVHAARMAPTISEMSVMSGIAGIYGIAIMFMVSLVSWISRRQGVSDVSVSGMSVCQ